MVSIDDTIAKKLDALGIDPASIKPNIMKHLAKIESVLTPKFTALTHSIEGVKGNRPSVLQVATEANIARQTLYNNPLLKEYVELRIEDYDRQDPYTTIECLRFQIQSLQDDIKKMQVRDVEIELLKKRITEMAAK